MKTIGLKKKLKSLDELIFKFSEISKRNPEFDLYIIKRLKIDRDLIAAEIGKKKEKNEKIYLAPKRRVCLSYSP